MKTILKLKAILHLLDEMRKLLERISNCVEQTLKTSVFISVLSHLDSKLYKYNYKATLNMCENYSSALKFVRACTRCFGLL